MKKIIAILLFALFVLSLAGCGSKPSEDKIKQALEAGTITFEDAMAKGWIDEEWVKKNFEQIEAKSKIYLFDPFETTYLNGTPASSKLIEGKMCLVFFNTQGQTTMGQLSVFNEVCKDMNTLGVPVLGVVTDEDLESARKSLTDVKFPVIVYNKEMQKSLELYSQIINTDITSVFTKEGGIYTAWCNNVTADSLMEFAEVLSNEK